MNRRSVAVVGAGVAGLTAAHVLSRTYDVVLYEADGPGGADSGGPSRQRLSQRSSSSIGSARI
ncbi:FAD-dependent oxidoreductase [Streptomyces sp900116325]|uniref:FAD-dependent oxidoreductase n=1 Tax=Streptomyces sp. 900116325 TaxID=3154295 RepID=UPI003321B40B